jgi:flavin-dependent dehydrogenase
MTVDFGPVVLAGRPAPAPDGTAVAYAPRRYRFDPMLADAAVRGGCHLRRASASSSRWSKAGVSSASGPGRRGSDRGHPARLVVGADGKRSRLAKAVGAQAYDSSPPRAAVTMRTGAGLTRVYAACSCATGCSA